MAKVLVVGSGGREHALGWKLAQSSFVEKVYFAPGNGGTTLVGTNVPIGMTDVDELLEFALKEKIDFTVVGQEAALEVAIVDKFTAQGLKIFGPTQSAARIETSKAFSSDFMRRHGIPTPEAVEVDTLDAALKYVKGKNPSTYVIKADGLATGKGVVLPESEEEAQTTLQDMFSGKLFGEAGNKVVFQEKLVGQEVSAFALSDGANIAMLPFFQDHKQIFDGDKGPNTGGMGAYTPVPIVTREIAGQIKDILQATITGMSKDGNPYKGVLYPGLFITKDGPKVIEYNARFGDPECQPMMQMVDEDFYELLMQSAEGKLKGDVVKTKPGASVAVCLASGGYPGAYEKGKVIKGLDDVTDSDVVVFHAGTKKEEGSEFVTNGGRVLNVTAYGSDLKSAVDKAYEAVKQISFEGMQYRTDIATKAF